MGRRRTKKKDKGESADNNVVWSTVLDYDALLKEWRHKKRRRKIKEEIMPDECERADHNVVWATVVDDHTIHAVFADGKEVLYDFSFFDYEDIPHWERVAEYGVLYEAKAERGDVVWPCDFSISGNELYDRGKEIVPPNKKTKS